VAATTRKSKLYGNGSEETRLFRRPEAYKADREFRKKVCAVAKKLPESEKFVLDPQMRKAALSVTNDVAEGAEDFLCGHIRFMLIARGSVEELPDDLNTCEDELVCRPPRSRS